MAGLILAVLFQLLHVGSAHAQESSFITHIGVNGGYAFPLAGGDFGKHMNGSPSADGYFLFNFPFVDTAKLELSFGWRDFRCKTNGDTRLRILPLSLGGLFHFHPGSVTLGGRLAGGVGFEEKRTGAGRLRNIDSLVRTGLFFGMGFGTVGFYLNLDHLLLFTGNVYGSILDVSLAVRLGFQ